jgi:23S rRNA (adenine2503-C2)-methyltransferase
MTFKKLTLVKRLQVPTGDILILKSTQGLVECLSLADYGKANNVKADFLGLTDKINGVSHGKLLPLEENGLLPFPLNTAAQWIVPFVMFQK